MMEVLVLFVALGFVSFVLALAMIAVWIFVIFVYPHIEGLVVAAEDFIVTTITTYWRHIRALLRRWFRSAASRRRKKRGGTHGARRG